MTLLTTLARTAACMAVAAVLLAGPFVGEAAAQSLDKGDGIHTESWFLNDSFLILAEDVADAAAEGKQLVVIWEQPGCGSCEQLHKVNLQDPAVRRYLEEHFHVMSMNMFGEVEVTDVDGAAMPEKDLAYKQRINFTPTTVFYGTDGQEVFRLPGYFSPYYWLAGFVYVAEKGYEDAEHRGMFPRWTAANREHLVSIYGAEPES